MFCIFAINSYIVLYFRLMRKMGALVVFLSHQIEIEIKSYIELLLSKWLSCFD